MLSFNTVGLCDETLSLAITFDRCCRESRSRKLHRADVRRVYNAGVETNRKRANYFRVEDVVGAVKNVTEKDVCKQELDVIQALGWEINAVTSVGVMLHLEELTHGVLNSGRGEGDPVRSLFSGPRRAITNFYTSRQSCRAAAHCCAPFTMRTLIA